MRALKVTGMLIALVAVASAAFTQETAQEPAGIVSYVEVLSDKVPDVSSMEAWKKSYISDGMTHEQKMLAIWKSVVLYRSQDSPPNEYLQNSINVHDPMKTFNVYGYGMCCCAASNVEALARYLGYPARGRIITAHSVPEVFYNDDWHLLDGSLINYFRDEKGEIASVDEIIDAVAQWFKENPEYLNAKGEPDAGKLRKFAANEGWKKGPKMFADSEYYARDGANLAGTHGWVSTLQEYTHQKGQIYEYGYSQGYQVNVQLRPGERLTRNWSNKGLHVNMREGDGPGILGGRRGMGFQRKLGDIAPGRVGNGVLEYDVPLKDGTLALTALAYEKVAPADGGIRATDAKGTLTLRMPSSYVYLTGKLEGKAVVAEGGRIVISFSDTNGTGWKHVETIDASGPVSLNLTDLSFRRYDYRLRFEMEGKGTGLDALKITHDVQHAQTPLPALGPGKNTITFNAGPAEGTITIEGSTNIDSGKAQNRQVLITDYQPELVDVKAHNLRMQKYGEDVGSMAFHVETPGDMKRIRMSAHYRARDARDGWKLKVSFDDGATWKDAGTFPGPIAATCKSITFEDVPEGARKATVKLVGSQRNTTLIFDLRIDADYAEPGGGFCPIKVTYLWTEGDQQKTDVHVAKSPSETWEIVCGEAPVMKSYVVELAE